MKRDKNIDRSQTRGMSSGINNRPEIRDNLDSREGEEQDTKGGDVTHNKKDVHNARPKKHDGRK